MFQKLNKVLSPESASKTDCCRREGSPCYCKWKEQLWNFLERPTTSMAATVWAIVVFFFILVSIAIVCMQTHTAFRVPRAITNSTQLNPRNITNPKQRMFTDTDAHPALLWLDVVCISVFVVELVLRYFSCPHKLLFFKSFYNIVDVLCVVPQPIVLLVQAMDRDLWEREFFAVLAFLSITSVLRVFRLFKLARHYRGLQLLWIAISSSFSELLLLFLLIFMGMLVFSTFIYIAEFSQPDRFEDIPIGFWWSIVTMTTGLYLMQRYLILTFGI